MRCLVVSGRRDQGSALCKGLSHRGHHVNWVKRLDGASEAIQQGAPDAIVIHRTVGRRDSVQAVQLWRAAGLQAIVAIVANSDGPTDRIVCLNGGADAVWKRPLYMAEVDSRLRALRRLAMPQTRGEREVLVAGSLTIDTRSAVVKYEGEILSMQLRELRILAELTREAGEPVSRARLYHSALNVADPGTKLLDTYVGRLRRTLCKIGISDALQTVRGQGYRFDVNSVRRSASSVHLVDGVEL